MSCSVLNCNNFLQENRFTILHLQESIKDNFINLTGNSGTFFLESSICNTKSTYLPHINYSLCEICVNNILPMVKTFKVYKCKDNIYPFKYNHTYRLSDTLLVKRRLFVVAVDICFPQNTWKLLTPNDSL